MTNKRCGTLYIGVTTDLPARVVEHRDGKGSSFCRRCNLDKLVYADEHATVIEAIAREKAMKAWKRDWKIDLIEKANPTWRDLWDDLA